MILSWLSRPVVQFVLFVAAWFVLMKWILPALGLPTCMGGACRTRPGTPPRPGDGSEPACPSCDSGEPTAPPERHAG